MRLFIIIIVAGVLGLMPVLPESGQIVRAQQEQDDALDAVRDASIIPYGRIKGTVERRYRGRVVGLQLIQAESGMWIYEFKILRQTGRLLNVFVDATTGRVIDTRGE